MNTFKFCPLCGAELADKIEEETRVRRACTSCAFIHYNNPTPVVAMIVEHEDDVVLVQNIGWPEKWFGLVSGFLEAGEAPDDGARREVFEELGVEPDDVSFIGVYPFAEMNQVIIAYRGVINAPPVMNTEELQAIKRVPKSKLRPWPMGTGAAVVDWIERRKMSS